ncbi:hypothetical protein Tco_1141841 [Tanacetum coccineum]
MEKLKENVHAIQVGCQLYRGAHFDKECPLNKEVKSAEEVKYGEFRRFSPFSNRAKYRMGSPRYYTRIDNHPPFRKKVKLGGAFEQAPRGLTKEFHAKVASEAPYSSVGQCKAVYVNDEAPIDNTPFNETNKVSFIANNEAQVAQEEDYVQ